MSQSSSALTTECNEHQVLSAKGITDGLRMAGRMAMASSTLSAGRFMRIYFLPRLLVTASMRKSNESSTACLSGARLGLAMSTASEWMTRSTSLSPLDTRVPPDDTMSKIASAMPAAGAISTDPLMTRTEASTPCSARKRRRILGYEVAMLLPWKYWDEVYSSALGMASEMRQPPKPSWRTMSTAAPVSATSL